MSFIEKCVPSFLNGMKPCNITNFPADDLGWYVKAIEKCGYAGFYIEKDVYTSDGCKLDDHYTLMAVGDYDMPAFWEVFDELKAKYPVCPEIGIQDVMFGPSAECQKLIAEMQRGMYANALSTIDAPMAAEYTKMSYHTQTYMEIEKYCLSCGLPAEMVEAIRATYKDYPAEVQPYMVSKPKFLYKDKHGYIKQAVSCILAGKPLLLSGGPGTGKNCLIETLAWIFQRPLFSVVIDSDTSAYDVTIRSKIALTRAMELGTFFCTEELNQAQTGVSEALRRAASRHLYIANFCDVEADKNFQLLATVTTGGNDASLHENLMGVYTQIQMEV